eukprot:34460-Amphidinium_carterae.1
MVLAASLGSARNKLNINNPRERASCIEHFMTCDMNKFTKQSTISTTAETRCDFTPAQHVKLASSSGIVSSFRG